MSKIIEPPFPYVAGKRRLLKHILPLIPRHDTYIEPFAGGLAVFMNKEPVKVEVVNDINDEVASFYRYVQYHYNSLLNELEGYLHSRETFDLLVNNPGHTELQRAARWYLLKVSSFSGFGTHYGRDKKSFRGFNRERHIPLICELKKRLANSYIESKDWEEVVSFFDKDTAFIYLDPPYCTGDSGIYDAFSEYDMTRVCKRLKLLKGQWLLSCDNSDVCQNIFKGMRSVVIPIKYSAGTNYQYRPSKSELLVMSDGIVMPDGFEESLK